MIYFSKHAQILLITTLLGVFCVVNNGFSQCKKFSKKNCLPNLLPFVHNGQMNNIKLFSGESASAKITFYSGQNYRLLVCNQPVLGDEVYFEVKNDEENLIYTNKNEGSNIWDFNVASTQNLTVTVFTPSEEDETTNDIAQSGCLSILIGFKK